MKRVALVVEDEADVGGLLAEHLRQWGYEPTVLSEGRPAVAWVQEHCPELILLDLWLPDMDGYDICEALKLDRRTNLIPLIMVTARCQPEDRVRGIQVGANRYLTKPFTPEELNRAILDSLSWREDLRRRGTEGEVHFHVRSNTEHLEDLNRLSASLFLFTGLTEGQIRELAIAVRELGANAIEWGHRNQVERLITVVYRIDPFKVTIGIRDTGPGFDPGSLPHAAQPGDPVGHQTARASLGLREGGFGILIARGLVDELTYNEAGNEVHLVKYFSPRRPAEAPELAGQARQA
jgi:CheY-like chemotaxis protein/anti-sigma regulatory factor (Ser/Thr protein kinase)